MEPSQEAEVVRLPLNMRSLNTIKATGCWTTWGIFKCIWNTKHVALWVRFLILNMKAGMLCDIGCKCRWRNIFQLSDGVVGSLFQATPFTFMLVFTQARCVICIWQLLTSSTSKFWSFEILKRYRSWQGHYQCCAMCQLLSDLPSPGPLKLQGVSIK